jgi:uncharacterized metal-binding protein YceD (DUF177 family)
MPDRFVIDLATLPEEGKQFTDELPPAIFDLRPDDPVPVSPLRYDLHVQRFGSELFLTGDLEAAFEFICVRTIHPFRSTIRLRRVPMSVEITSEAPIDVTDALREEILIQFPADPVCDDADDPMTCEIDPRYLAVDKPPEVGVEPAPPRHGDQRWAALDALKDLPREQS